jgi:hypothetical protein
MICWRATGERGEGCERGESSGEHTRRACWRWRPRHRGLFLPTPTCQRAPSPAKDCFGATPKPARGTRALSNRVTCLL